MTSHNPMALEPKALEAVRVAQERFDQIDCAGFTQNEQSQTEVLEHVKMLARDGSRRMREALAALPLPAAGEGLEPMAWRWRWSKLGSNTAWHFSPVKPGPFPEEGYEIEPLYADRRTRPPASSMEGWAEEGAVRVLFIPRPDGGLRVSSPDLPGLILSGADPAKVAADVPVAIKALQEHRALAASPIPPEVMK